MKVEKELVDIFNLHPNNMTMLNQIIQQAFRCQNTADPKYKKMREFRVFLQVGKHFLMSLTILKGI